MQDKEKKRMRHKEKGGGQAREVRCEDQGRHQVQEARVGPFIESLLARGEREALLVGHGTSVQAAMRHVLRRFSPRHLADIPPTKPWNCALTSFRLRPCFELLAMVCTEHLPEEAITSNIRPKAEVLRRYRQRLAAAREIRKNNVKEG